MQAIKGWKGKQKNCISTSKIMSQKGVSALVCDG